MYLIFYLMGSWVWFLDNLWALEVVLMLTFNFLLMSKCNILALHKNIISCISDLRYWWCFLLCFYLLYWVFHFKHFFFFQKLNFLIDFFICFWLLHVGFKVSPLVYLFYNPLWGHWHFKSWLWISISVHSFIDDFYNHIALIFHVFYAFTFQFLYLL